MPIGLKTDQTTWTWGSNNWGRLGNDTNVFVMPWNYPIQSIPGRHSFTFLACCFHEVLGRKSDGTIWGWGQNTDGQLGDGTKTNRTSPVMMIGNHTCTTICVSEATNASTHFLKDDGSMWGTGDNSYGTLGDYTITNRSSPVQVVGNHSFIKIAGHQNSVYGLKADGSCWGIGQNVFGQLGQNNRTNCSSPIVMVGNHSFIDIACGMVTFYALKADGTAWVCGYNDVGQLGTNNMISYSSPVQIVGSHSFIKVYASRNTAGWLKADGSLWTCGYGAYGALGNNSTASYSSPVQVVGNHSFVGVTTVNGLGTGSNFALKADGSVWGWGGNQNGILGQGLSGTASSTSSPVKVIGGYSFSQILATSDGMLGLVDNLVYTWGYQTQGEIGGISNENSTSPVMIIGNHSFRNILMSSNFAVGRKANGEVWTWGINDSGQLGRYFGAPQLSPVQVLGNHTFVGIAANINSAIARKSDGSVWAWGSFFETGTDYINLSLSRSSPVQLVGNHSFASLSSNFSNYYYSHFLKEDGSVWSVGNNGAGQLGTGNRTNYSFPVIMIGNHSFIKIAGGTGNCFNLKSNGSTWVCGQNDYGQLGTNNRTSYSSPVAVVGNHVFIDVCAGAAASYGLKANGSVWASGSGLYGALGVYVASCSSPITVVGNHSFIQISAGSYQCHGLKADGSVWSWGKNDMAALGHNDNVNYSSPVQLVGNHSVIAVVGCSDAGYALKADGSVWGWGAQSVGTGAPLNYSSPVQVIGGNSFIKIVAGWNISGNNSVYGLKANGEVWSWGYNNLGQLGLNNTTNYVSFPTLTAGNHSFVDITSGIGTAMAKKADGSVWLWGDNTYYMLSMICPDNRSSPTVVLGNHSFIQIAGINTTINADIRAAATNLGSYSALKSDGSCWTWGYNSYGQLGNNTIISQYSPVQVVGNHSFIKIFPSGESTKYAMKADGSVWSWGRNNYLQLGVGLRYIGLANQSSPVVFAGTHSFVTLFTGEYTTVGLKSNGEIWVSGSNTNGELGVNDRNNRSSPVQMVGNHSFVSFAGGGSHALALKADGSTWAMGQNQIGQLGTNTAVSYSSPVAIVGSHSFASIYAGQYLSAGLKADTGAVWAWGDNTYGQLGQNNRISYSSPVAVVGNHSFTTLSAGIWYIMGLKDDGQLWAWGDNSVGELGTQNTVSYSSPVTVVGNHSFVQIAAFYHNAALKSDGSVWTWGNNSYGELGHNTRTNASSPTLVVGNHSFISVSAGLYHTMGLKSDGSLWMWGSNSDGQLGNNTTTSYSSPIQVVGNHSFVSLGCAAYYHSAARKANGQIWSWGRNSSGELGISFGAPGDVITSSSSPVQVVGNHSFIEIEAGRYHVLGRKIDGTVWAWGNNTDGQLGINILGGSYDSPLQVIGNHSFVEICAYDNSSYARKANGEVWSWGDNDSSQLGNGIAPDYATSKMSPVQITVGNHTFASVIGGGRQAIGLKSDGSAWGWGYNINGELGVNTRTSYSSPVKVVGNHSFIAVAIGTTWTGNSTAFLKADGSAWTCGQNGAGQLGNNTTASASSPVAVVGGHSFAEVAAAATWMVARKADTGAAWTWGEGFYGCMGNNTRTSYSSPIQVVGNHSFIRVANALYNGFGLKADGSLWGWGRNQSGQLGTNNMTSYSSPVLVVGNHSFITVSAGEDSTAALKANGEIWCWGRNINGNLGTNNTTSYSSPVLVVGNHSFVYLVKEMGSSQECAGLKADGSVWAWGLNDYGQLGQNNNINYSSPVKVIGNHSFVKITDSGYTGGFIALKADGIAWVWGDNRAGQLTNSRENRISPVQVVGSHILNTIGGNNVGVTSELSFATPLIWGEENPTQGEIKFKWDIWSDAGYLQPVFTSSYGTLNVKHKIAVSDVVWLSNAAQHFLKIRTNTYSAGSGSGKIYIRGSTIEFAQDDELPVWEEWTAPVSKTWKYIQLKLVASSS